MKSKPWMKQDHNTFRCENCGGISIFKEGVKIPSQRIGTESEILTYWKWRKKFKQHHSQCVANFN